VASGQVHRYVVPVLDFDPRLELAAGRPPIDGELPALPAGYTPIEQEAGVGVREGIAQANRQELQRNSRSAAPVGDADWEDDGVSAPVPDDPAVGPTGSASGSEPVTEQMGGTDSAGEGAPDPEPAPEPTPEPEPVPTPPEDAEPKFISDAQRRRLHTIRRKIPVLEPRAKEIIKEVTGQESSSKIPTHLYDTVIAKIQAEETGQDALL